MIQRLGAGRRREGAADCRPLACRRSADPHVRLSLFHLARKPRPSRSGKPFQRLMLALDTGSAIVGPARGDIFTGSGDEAGELAGAVRTMPIFSF
jgi:membrane-bound lytic murein transglycosylase